MIFPPHRPFARFFLLAALAGFPVIAAVGKSKPADPLLGKTVYAARCAQCHGAGGKGDGPPSSILNARPRDFTSGTFEFRSTESGSIPTDNDLFNSVKNGLHGSAMPDWGHFVSDDTLRSVVEFIKTFSPRFRNEKPKSVHVGAPVPASPASIAAGRRAFERLQCGKCHGNDGEGTDAIATDLKDDGGNAITATTLTEPWTFRGGSNARDVYLRFRTGLDGTPMPSYKGAATEADMWNLANYIVSIGRKPVWKMNETELKELYSKLDRQHLENPLAWGKYLVETMGCGYCHTPMREDGSLMEDLRYAGGQRWRLVPFGDFVSYNLTSDKATGLGGWTDDELKKLLTTGIRRDGSRMYPFPMPWIAYAGLKSDDMNALVAYLRSLPAIYNKIPEPQTANFFAYMWGKFRMLILKDDLPFYAYPGNAGTEQGKPTTSIDGMRPHQPEGRRP
ncbi:MAG TPA: c-type cytochrome [Bacteroidota bacterium]|nr:c-type cytochrome [Bacteroidota bacterium]